MSRETTFEKDLHPARDRQTLGLILAQLCERLSVDLIAKNYLGETIGIRVRYGNFQSITRDITIDIPTNSTDVIRQAARQCLKRIDLVGGLRLLGVIAGNLQKLEEATGPNLKAAEEVDQGL